MMRYVGLTALCLAACDRALPREPVGPIDPFEGLELTLDLDTTWVASGGPFGARLLLRNTGDEATTLGDACGGGLALPLLIDADGGAYRLLGGPTECSGGLQELALAAGEVIERTWELHALALGQNAEQELQRLATGTYTFVPDLTIAHVAGKEVGAAPSIFAELEVQEALDPVRISFVVAPDVVQPFDSLVVELLVENVSPDMVELESVCTWVPFIPRVYDPDGDEIQLAGQAVPICLGGGDWWDVAPGDTLRLWHPTFERDFTRYEFLAAHRPDDAESEPEPLAPGVYKVAAQIYLERVNGIPTWVPGRGGFQLDAEFEVLASSP